MLRRAIPVALLLASQPLAAGEIRVPNYAFDPLTLGEPALAPALRAVPGGHQLRLVQLEGGVRQEHLDALAALGSKPLQYYPHDTYLVWADEALTDVMASQSFVRWQGLFHPAYKIAPSLSSHSGLVENVDVVIFDDGHLEGTLAQLRNLGAAILNHYPSQPDRAFWDAVLEVDASALEEIARLDAVLWLGYLSPKPALEDEMSDQIAAGNHTAGVPFTGYISHLASLGYDGSGVIWSITDTGVDYDHPDLNTRIVGGTNYPGCVTPNPGDESGGGHGTHVAGIAMGDASAGFTDGDGFLYGLGMAPGASIWAQNPICIETVPWPPAGGWQVLSKNGLAGGAVGANNSWHSGEGTHHGYQSTERTHDFMVRDGDFDTAGAAEPYILVFSAGNAGANGLTAPKEAKNLVVAAGSLNSRAGDIDAIWVSSSRGPAVDGRQVPTIAAPGKLIASTMSDDGGICTSPISNTNNLYSLCTGTSMASPHASGAVILITEWWRDLHGGADPSPAMAKALLVNTAVDMGTADRWNTAEGWGRIQITDVLAPALASYYEDQGTVFDASAEQWQKTFQVDDPGQPLKITLTWSDAPGAVGANPALVNDLDLTVETGGLTYLGNVFSGGWSTTGGTADALDNTENVFVQSPGSQVTITVDATAINGDGVPIFGDATDQDFALVCTNCVDVAIFVDGFESGNTSAWSVTLP